MPEVLGIEKLKKAVSLSIRLGQEFARLKKANIITILGLISEIRELLEMIKDRKAILAEFKDISPDERQELLELVKEEFDIADDKAEAYAEDALTWALSTITMVERAKEL